MRTVLIVGAGATRAEAETKQFSRGKLPPLDTDFFRLCRYHRVTENLITLRKYVLKHYQIDVDEKPQPRMEEVFGIVYADTSLKPIPPRARQAFVALCRVYNRVILDTTNQITPSTRGPTARLVNHCLQSGKCEIVTFNHDIVIEKALSAMSRTHPPWFPQTGYLIEFNEYTSAQGAEIPKFTDSNGRDSMIKVRKLHGSLNWYTTTASLDRVPYTLPKKKSIKCTTNKTVHPEMQFVRPAKRGRKSWYTWPVMVPPVYEKGAFLTAVLSPIWDDARAVLTDAEQIVVYGYSFPEADQQGRSFFRRCRASNASLRRVVVINPDPNAALAANEILSPPVLIVTHNVKTFLETEA